MTAACLELSPGEVERYERETAHRLRSERLRQVRCREDVLAKKVRMGYQGRMQQEEQQRQAVEVKAQLEAKRAKLASLLEEKALCDAACGTAARAAAEHRHQQVLEAAKKERVEANRRVLEAKRGDEALQLRRDARLAELRAEQEQLDRQWQIREDENKRAQAAAEAGRDVSLARRTAEQEAEAQRQQALKAWPRRVRLTTARGNVDYSKTYFHVMCHDTDVDEPGVEAEFHRPLSPQPAVTPSQRQQATDRGRVAEALLASQRLDADLEQRVAKQEVQDRTAKVQRVVAAQVAAAPRAPVPRLGWGVLAGRAKVAAEAEIEGILADAKGDRFQTDAEPSQSDTLLAPEGSLAGSATETLRPSPAWGLEARSVVARATQSESVNGAGSSWWLPSLDDTLDTSEASSAAASSTGRGASPRRVSPASPSRQMRHIAPDVDSSCTDSPFSGMLYDDVILDGMRDSRISNAAAGERIAANSRRELPAVGRDLPLNSDVVPSMPPLQNTKPEMSNIPEIPGSTDQNQEVKRVIVDLGFDGPVDADTVGARDGLPRNATVEPIPTVSLTTSDSAQPSPELGTHSALGMPDVVAARSADGQEDDTGHAVCQGDSARHRDDLKCVANRGGSSEASVPAWRESDHRASARLEEKLEGEVTERTPTGESPLPGADRLEGLLSEAEALLRETAITAAMAAAAANEPDPFLDNVLAVASDLQFQRAAHTLHDEPPSTTHAPAVAGTPRIVQGYLGDPDALLDAVDGFLGVIASRMPESTGHATPVPTATAGSSARGAQSPPAVASGDAAVANAWVSDAQRWDGGDLGAQLEEICRELDEVVGLSTARGRELEMSRPSPWPLPHPLTA